MVGSFVLIIVCIALLKLVWIMRNVLWVKIQKVAK